MGCCCSSLRAKNEGSPRSGRRPRRRRGEGSLVSANSAGPSLIDAEDFHSCRDDFSVTDTSSGPLSPMESPPAISPPATPQRHTSPSRVQYNGQARGGLHCRCNVMAHDHPTNMQIIPQKIMKTTRRTAAVTSHVDTANQSPRVEQLDRRGSIEGASDSMSYVDSLNSEAFPQSSNDRKGVSAVGCLSLVEALTSKLANHLPVVAETPKRTSIERRKKMPTSVVGKLNAGFSLNKRDLSVPWTDIVCGYEDGDSSHFNIRSLDYMKTKTKVHSAGSIYNLIAADMVYFDRKQNHIAKLINLPVVPPAKHKLPTSDDFFPPLLIINLQLPAYPASFFGGASDGVGWSCVYYFKLPDNFDPVTFPNQKALGLLSRFLQNGKEADGTHTRERLKMIPRVVNVDEWAVKGPLSPAEHKLLSSYNEKPVLTRPQQLFFQGSNYFEVDIDIHSYTWMARTALSSFNPRLATVIWEVAFVIEGRGIDELPEQLLGSGRLYRTDFSTPRPFTSFLSQSLQGGTLTQQDKEDCRS